MTSDIARSFLLEDIDVQSLAVDVVHENAITIVLRPSSAQVDHRTGMRVPAARLIGLAVPAVWCRPDVMPMVGDSFNIVVGVWVEVHAPLSFVTCPLDDVVQVRDNAGGKERLTTVVEIDTPWVARSVREDFKNMSRRMVTPNSSVDTLAIFVRCSWLANTRVSEDTMATIEPTIWSPNERVERLVRVLIPPTV